VDAHQSKQLAKPRRPRLMRRSMVELAALLQRDAALEKLPSQQLIATARRSPAPALCGEESVKPACRVRRIPVIVGNRLLLLRLRRRLSGASLPCVVVSPPRHSAPNAKERDGQTCDRPAIRSKAIVKLFRTGLCAQARKRASVVAQSPMMGRVIESAPRHQNTALTNKRDEN